RPASCSSRTPASAASSTWAALRSPTTSAFWNASNSRPARQPICASPARPGRSSGLTRIARQGGGCDSDKLLFYYTQANEIGRRRGCNEKKNRKKNDKKK